MAFAVSRARPEQAVRRGVESAPVRVGLIGLGTVGSSVARILTGGAHEKLRLTRVCTRPGSVKSRPAWLPADVDSTSRFEDLLAPDIDVVVELVGGLDPAGDWITRALLARKSVVTANKQLIADAGPRLSTLAARQRRQLRFGASVAGGVPVIEAIREGLAGDRLTAVNGVLNGTCNYVLTRMEQAGIAFDDALREAQAHGYAEADPSADIEGLDARAKLAILCAVALGCTVRPEDIPCASIAGITPEALADARAAGSAIRQVAHAQLDPGSPGGVRASVGPERISRDSILARVQGCQNAVIVTGEYGGDTAYVGRGAGGNATAVAVISDLLAIAATERAGNGPAREASL